MPPGFVLSDEHYHPRQEELKRKDAPLRVLFSGDLGNPHSSLVEGPKPAPLSDYIFMETTYGCKSLEKDPQVELQDFRERWSRCPPPKKNYRTKLASTLEASATCAACSQTCKPVACGGTGKTQSTWPLAFVTEGPASCAGRFKPSVICKAAT
jgi:hypothetical protein